MLVNPSVVVDTIKDRKKICLNTDNKVKKHFFHVDLNYTDINERLTITTFVLFLFTLTSFGTQSSRDITPLIKLGSL